MIIYIRAWTLWGGGRFGRARVAVVAAFDIKYVLSEGATEPSRSMPCHAGQLGLVLKRHDDARRNHAPTHARFDTRPSASQANAGHQRHKRQPGRARLPVPLPKHHNSPSAHTAAALLVARGASVEQLPNTMVRVHPWGLRGPCLLPRGPFPRMGSTILDHTTSTITTTTTTSAESSHMHAHETSMQALAWSHTFSSWSSVVHVASWRLAHAPSSTAMQTRAEQLCQASDGAQERGLVVESPPAGTGTTLISPRRRQTSPVYHCGASVTPILGQDPLARVDLQAPEYDRASSGPRQFLPEPRALQLHEGRARNHVEARPWRVRHAETTLSLVGECMHAPVGRGSTSAVSTRFFPANHKACDGQRQTATHSSNTTFPPAIGICSRAFVWSFDRLVVSLLCLRAPAKRTDDDDVVAQATGSRVLLPLGTNSLWPPMAARLKPHPLVRHVYMDPDQVPDLPRRCLDARAQRRLTDRSRGGRLESIDAWLLQRPRAGQRCPPTKTKGCVAAWTAAVAWSSLSDDMSARRRRSQDRASPRARELCASRSRPEALRDGDAKSARWVASGREEPFVAKGALTRTQLHVSWYRQCRRLSRRP